MCKCVNALVIIHEVPPRCAVGLADWYAVSPADNYRRRITEETIILNVGMRFKNVLTCECVNALVGMRFKNV